MHRAFGPRTWLMFAIAADLALAGRSQASSSGGGPANATADRQTGRAEPVSGLGEAAFANVPLSGGLMIKQGKYEIDVGVVNFNVSHDRAVATAQALAALVLPRVAAGAR